MDNDSDLSQAYRRGVWRFCCIILSPVIAIAILSGWFMCSVYGTSVGTFLGAALAGGLVAGLAMLCFVWVIGMMMEMIETVRSIFD